jgi:hypothetical protein
MVWAFAHGVACLLIDEHLKLACPVEEFLDRSFEAMLSGLKPAAAGRPHRRGRTIRR